VNASAEDDGVSALTEARSELPYSVLAAKQKQQQQLANNRRGAGGAGGIAETLSLPPLVAAAVAPRSAGMGTYSRRGGGDARKAPPLLPLQQLEDEGGGAHVGPGHVGSDSASGASGAVRTLSAPSRLKLPRIDAHLL
jgi:hypothetical protein